MACTAALSPLLVSWSESCRNLIKDSQESVKLRPLWDRREGFRPSSPCPNPYFALESLSAPHEAWWLNAFASGADTTRVVNAYAANRPLTEALGAVRKRMDSLVGTPSKGFGVYHPELSRSPAWSVAGARFM